MVLSLRRIARRLTFVMLFVLLTLSVSAALRLLNDWLRMPDPYAVPHGHAVKVFGNADEAGSGREPFADRLRLFYITGE